MKKDKAATAARGFRDWRSYVAPDGREVLYGVDWNERKKEVWDRGGGRCERITGDESRCRSEMQDPHHILPRHPVRDDRINNLIGLCRLHHDLEDERKLHWKGGKRS